MKTIWFCCTLLATHALACRAQRITPHKLAPAVSVTQSVASGASAASGACRAPAPAALDEAALKRALTAWRAAQNSPDFTAYSAFYAAHFTGLVQHGQGVSLVDRKAWLAGHEFTLMPRSDREAAPQIAIGAGGAQVTLADEELFFIPTASGPKIAWQAPARPAVAQLSAQPGLWLADESSALLSSTPEASWADGAPVTTGPSSAALPVAVARLPKAFRSWLGRPVKVLGATGAVCETRLQRFSLRAQITPDLTTAEHWEGCAEGPAIPPETIARDIWRLSAASGRSLVAEFSIPCKGALLAIDPNLPAPAIAAPVPASADAGAAFMQAFRGLPAYAEIEARFHAEHPDRDGAWDDHDARRSISTLELPGHARLSFVSVETGAGCGSFSASLSALWERDGSGITLTSVDDRRLTPRAVVDLDGTGSAVLLGPDGLFQARSVLRVRSGAAATYARDFLSSVPFFAGPC